MKKLLIRLLAAMSIAHISLITASAAWAAPCELKVCVQVVTDPATNQIVITAVQNKPGSTAKPKPKGTPRYYQPVEQLPYGEQAQVDFGEYWMVNADEYKVKVHFMIMLLSRSRQKFVSFSQQPITTLFVLDAHEQAFAFFEGIPVCQ